jgi:hypothetical protein
LKQRFARRSLKERLSKELSKISVTVTVDKALEIDPSGIHNADSSIVKDGEEDSGAEKFAGLTNEKLFGLNTGKTPTHTIVRTVDVQKERPVWMSRRLIARNSGAQARREAEVVMDQVRSSGYFGWLVIGANDPAAAEEDVLDENRISDGE